MDRVEEPPTRFCVFCGERPRSKSREHIIPQWLIKLTGDPNRQIYVGRAWYRPTLPMRQFSFSRLVFPACEQCNGRFAELEGRAQSVMKRILARDVLAAQDWDLFLDWLDKIRIGLWLGMLFLNKNHRGISPRFFIEGRIGTKDRFVLVYEIEDDGQEGVIWLGTETPLFEYTPSCFALVVNNFLFLNASFDFLFSRRLGFPYASRVEVHDGRDLIDLENGTGKIRLPLLQKAFPPGGTRLWQPIIPWRHLQADDGSPGDVRGQYDTAFVRSHCLDFDTGKGKIFSDGEKTLSEYPSTPSASWIPPQKHAREYIVHRSALAAGDFLELLFRSRVLAVGPKEHETGFQETGASTLRLHRTIMNHILRQRQ